MREATTIHPDDRRAHIEALRERKRAEAEAIGIDADYISALVERFYGKIREDALLGPIFAERISDWDLHLGRMKGFWRSASSRRRSSAT
jgi:hemoglobin